jgi:hypothetical protein
MTDEDLPRSSESDDEDEDLPEGAEQRAPPAPPIVGPVAGAMVGVITFLVLGDRFSLLPRLGLSLVVIAVVAYLSVLIARRRG